MILHFWDDVKSLWPLWVGLSTCYKGGDKEKRRRESEQILKNHHSSDCSLEFENMKSELIVIVNKHVTVNLYPNLVQTARHATVVGDFARSLLD